MTGGEILIGIVQEWEVSGVRAFGASPRSTAGGLAGSRGRRPRRAEFKGAEPL